jgi:uncharacterized membrane protein
VLLALLSQLGLSVFAVVMVTANALGTTPCVAPDCNLQLTDISTVLIVWTAAVIFVTTIFVVLVKRKRDKNARVLRYPFLGVAALVIVVIVCLRLQAAASGI